MFALLRFLFLCALAIASGVAAVSFTVAGKTPAEHVRHYVHELAGMVEAAPAMPRVPQAHARLPAHKPDDRPPADSIRDDERAALDHLIGEKAR